MDPPTTVMLMTYPLFLSFPPSSSNTHVATHISDCLADISAWTAVHHLKLNLNKTELLFIPWKDCPRIDLSVTVENIKVLPSSMAGNLGVNLDNGLSCTPYITAVARSCRYPSTTSAGSSLLVISLLDYCNSLLAGIPASATKLLQRIQYAAAHLHIYILPKCSHVTPPSMTSTGSQWRSWRLPNNFAVAKQKILGLRRKFLNNSQVHKEYSSYLSVVTDKGYAEPVPHSSVKV